LSKDRSLYSASDVARLSGAPLRAVRYWALTRVLEAAPESDRAGTGKHRQFSKQEVLIACIVQYFAAKGLQVGQLTKISKTFRETILTDDVAVRCLDGAISNSFKVHMTVNDWDQDWITLISERSAAALGAPSASLAATGTITRAPDKGPPKVEAIILPATDQNLAWIFQQTTDEAPGFICLLLNGCFLHLRSEWHK
jgi:DNA-binding transcriptional MerR regulator